MVSLKLDELNKKEIWEECGISLPNFDVESVKNKTKTSPMWVHFGPGNIFRGYIAYLGQKAIEAGMLESGITAVASYDAEMINLVYRPFDNLALQVVMNEDGTLKKTVVASICESLDIEDKTSQDWDRVVEIFENPSLQMVTFTITEKGYALFDSDKKFFKFVEKDIEDGPVRPTHMVSMLACLLYKRWEAGAAPIALVSMDNFSHNGERLRDGVLTIAKMWLNKRLVKGEFLNYLMDETKISFPWTMIDKITPRPSELVAEKLLKNGFKNVEIFITNKQTYIAPFVNTEVAEYLVIEDKFPNGRVQLECAGVYFTDKETVNKIERMKVCTCLNPLHTALAIFGCLLGYTSIAGEMSDPELLKLIKTIGYIEGIPVVVENEIINPTDFLNEVIEKRLPNPFIPDTPQRIATDTSQKLSIRYGETIKSYVQNSDLDVQNLKAIPLTIAGWCRYLMGVYDNGKEMELCADPMLKILLDMLDGINVLDAESVNSHLKGILSNKVIFGVDLYEVNLADRIIEYFISMNKGVGAVRQTLRKELETL